MVDKNIKNNSSNVKIDKREKDPKVNPYGKDKFYVNNTRVDNNGMWDPANRNQPIMVMGNSMSTEGYNMPLYVQPNGGQGFVVPPNVGTLDFGPNVNHFIETPIARSGGSLNRKVTCSNCGWSWRLVDGGTNPTTCHKCGGMIKMKEGGWLDTYQTGGINKPKVYTDYEEYLKAQKAYDDSLAAYNMGNRMMKEYNDAIRRGKEAGTPLRIIPKNHLTPYPGTNILPIESRAASPTGTDYGPEDADFSLWATYSRFKKPVQPVGYEKSKQEILPVRTSSTPIKKPKNTVNNKGQHSIRSKPSYQEFLKTVNPDFLGPDYNLEEAYKNLPYEMMNAWAKDPNKNHLPDTYKLPNHPTFSNESIYYQPGMKAGKWEGENYVPIEEEKFSPHKFIHKDNRGTYYWHQKTPSTTIPLTKEEYMRLSNIPEKAYGGDPSLPALTGHFQIGGVQLEGYNDNLSWLGDTYKDLGASATKGRLNLNAGNYFPTRTFEPSKMINPYVGVGVDLNKNRNLDFQASPDYLGFTFTKTFKDGGSRQFGGKFSKTDTHYQVGGFPTVQYINEGNSEFNPYENTIRLNMERMDDLGHELYHYQQYEDDDLRIPGFDPYGRARRRPSIVEEQELVDYPYYNRRKVDLDLISPEIQGDFIASNPDFEMVNPELIYKYVVEPAMYNDPNYNWTAEGEARLSETPEGIEILRQRGREPRYSATDLFNYQTGIPTRGELDMYQPGGTKKSRNIPTQRDQTGYNPRLIRPVIIGPSTANKKISPEENLRNEQIRDIEKEKFLYDTFPNGIPFSDVSYMDPSKYYLHMNAPIMSEEEAKYLATEEGTIKPKTKKQSTASKAYEVFKNPVTAASYVAKKQRVPDYFSEGETSDLDEAIQFSPLHMAALTGEMIHNVGKAAINPQTYKDIYTVATSTTPSAEYLESLSNLGQIGTDAFFTRAGIKQGKNIYKNIKSKVAQRTNTQAANPIKTAAQAKRAENINIRGKALGLQPTGAGPKNVKYVVLPKHTTYGPISTPVFEGKYPMQSPSGNIKGDYFDLRNTGYTDIPGFNKQVRDLMSYGELGVRPLEKKIPLVTKRPQQLVARLGQMEANKDYQKFAGSYDMFPEINKPFTFKEAYNMGIQPNKKGGQIKLKKRKATSQNIQTSVNDIMMRNELLFGPPGKRRFIPYKQDGGESDMTGGWLDNYL